MMGSLRDTVTSAERRRSYEASGAWDDQTLPVRVAQHAALRGEAIAVVDLVGRRTRTFGQLWSDATRVAGYLRTVGVSFGDVVSVQLPNWYETVVIDLAVLSVGAIVNPLLPIYRERELRHVLETGGVQVIFVPSVYRRFDHAQLAGQLQREVASLEQVVTVADPVDSPDAFATWLDSQPSAWDPAAARASAVSELIFTSGTEAEPKAIMHTEQTANFSMRAAYSSLGMSSDDVVWMPSPIGHSTGFNFGVRMALYHGLPLVLQDRWDPADAVAMIERWRCSYTLAATTFVNDIVELPQSRASDLSSLRLFGCGGAPVPPSVVAAAGDLGIGVLRLYGSTEVLVATWNRPDSPEDRLLTTDGPPLDGVEVQVRDEHGQVTIGEPGEIFVRGPNTSVGFYGDPDRTQATYESTGWVRSGDIGVSDPLGYLTVVGRRKEIIIRGGMNIAPREIEDVIAQHPDVVEVAVVGVPSERLGERACACVVVRSGATITLAHLVDFLRARGLANYKLPERLELLDELPRTLSGKVKKFEIVAAISGAPGRERADR